MLTDKMKSDIHEVNKKYPFIITRRGGVMQTPRSFETVCGRVKVVWETRHFLCAGTWLEEFYLVKVDNHVKKLQTIDEVWEHIYPTLMQIGGL